MANKNLFSTLVNKLARGADQTANTVNEAGGVAYTLSPEGALAQLAATGCLNHTYYANAETQLSQVLALCLECEPEYVAKVAIYARERGYMKDMPALLCAYLAAFDPVLFEVVFDRVIDNGKMLRNFVQIVRSGVTGRRSLGSLPKRKIREWLDGRTDEQLFKAAVGNNPSLADVIKMVHPRPKSKSRAALYGYLIGKDVDEAQLPALVREYEAFKQDMTRAVPDVPFQMLTSLELEREHWVAIAKNAPWQMTRMNLNTFVRHDVFKSRELEKRVARRLSDKAQVKKARAFPYQLLAAYVMADKAPRGVRKALKDAMEISISNVPELKGRVVVAPDVSGSMHCPVTGYRAGATSAVRCIDVAGLMAAAVLRKNPRARVLPFEHKVVNVNIRPEDSVLENAAQLASIGGGGTACSAPLARLVKERAEVDLVIMVSDNESWRDTGFDRITETMRQWDAIKSRNPKAKLVCIDIQPYTTVQAREREDILHVGGFSDAVFDVIAAFAKGELGKDRWVSVVGDIDLGLTKAA